MRSRLLALILIPTLVAVILGGLRVTTSISSAGEYQRVSDVAVLITNLGALGHVLGAERDMSTKFVASGRNEGDLGELERQQSLVDNAAAKVIAQAQQIEGDLSELGQRKLQRLQDRLRGLKDLRLTVTKSLQPALPTLEKYSEVMSDLLTIYDEAAQGTGDEELISTAAAVGALARMQNEISKQRGLLAIGLVRGRFESSEFEAFQSAKSRKGSERDSFRIVATPEQRQLFDDTVSGLQIGRSELYVARAILLTNEGVSLRRLEPQETDDMERWMKSSTETTDRVNEVEKKLAESITLRTTEVQGAEQRAALISAALVLVLLVLIMIVTTIMARSLVRPLRQLRSGALDVAGNALPSLVRRLRESGDTETVRVEPIGVDSEDEVGEVARAFDEVHREAVRLAGEESRLRSNVNAMFVNLSRRSQTLVERQITLIDGLEQGEQDEARLANLFKLDHLATRMRRNSENLLVLAGQDPPRRWSQPVKLVDVARASLSEVENYERVSLQVPDNVAVAGQAVNDVIHLLAELVENALSFSPRETRVTVSGSRIDGGGVMLSITDSGIGMTQEELVQANERLTDAPTVDVSVSRRMGLFVVARLAHRHGIRVQLRPHGSGGLTAMVLVPEALLGAQPAAFAGTPAVPDPFTAQPFSGPQAPFAGPQAPFAGSHPSFDGPPSAPAWQSAPVGAQFPPDTPGGSWPSMPVWPSEPAWPSDPQRAVASGAFDTADTWMPSRTPSRPAPEEASTWTFGDRKPPSYDFPETESTATGPIPVVGAPSSGDEFLPIFASVESAWFEHSEGSSLSWGTTKADAGWTAAEAAREPVRDGATQAGLPKRVPKANLVPGSADTVTAPKGVEPMPQISPDRVRSRLSSFQQGFRAAREDLTEGKAYPSGPRNVDSREEGE
ncbi:nitrate- and nitrite sensing domain-containing protein [Nonomuraea sp. NPDC050556]|uniref:sensor histidine kinase n=1 Tax=Nonomuraea sp. NPDC050556 TaxID=3364369 RepID=UPI00378C7CA8